MFESNGDAITSRTLRQHRRHFSDISTTLRRHFGDTSTTLRRQLATLRRHFDDTSVRQARVSPKKDSSSLFSRARVRQGRFPIQELVKPVSADKNKVRRPHALHPLRNQVSTGSKSEFVAAVVVVVGIVQREASLFAI